ncbi:MAG TPA: hypothetical protein VG870_08445 [Chitinophagaceae bacterium]|nr:hypothetical protein [Chitinophagaceae bacterium]
MKKSIIAMLMIASLAVHASGPVDVNEKIMRAFKQTFSLAQDVVWHQQGQVYQASFWQNDINIRAKYDEGGNLLQTIRYYAERNLPPNILAHLKNKYGNRSVFGVTEVTSENEVTYFVTMQDARHWYTVKADMYGNSEQTEKIRKTDPQ